MADKRYSLTTQIAEVARELQMRRQVYPGLVNSRAKRQAEADMQIAIMEGVLATLQWLQKNEDAIKAGDETRENYAAALRLIRETLEQFGPPGTLPSGEAVNASRGPLPLDEATVICEALVKLLAPAKPA